jgi:hypothetical protein
MSMVMFWFYDSMPKTVPGDRIPAIGQVGAIVGMSIGGDFATRHRRW